MCLVVASGGHVPLLPPLGSGTGHFYTFNYHPYFLCLPHININYEFTHHSKLRRKLLTQQVNFVHCVLRGTLILKGVSKDAMNTFGIKLLVCIKTIHRHSSGHSKIYNSPRSEEYLSTARDYPRSNAERAHFLNCTD